MSDRLPPGGPARKSLLAGCSGRLRALRFGRRDQFIWRDLYLWKRDHAGCTMKKARQVPGLDNVESAGSWQVFRYGRR